MASKRIWGWYFFDWASQPYSTLLLTFTFGPYFSEVASAKFLSSGMDQAAANAAAQTYWTTGQTITGLLIACLAPILGAVADGSGRRMPWIWAFSALYVVGSWALWFLSPVQPDLFMAMVWFGLGLIGMEFATIFTNSLMPDIVFYLCGCAIGAAGGTLQAASRTMMVFHTTPDRATEAFGLYALSGKATTYLGTMGIALFTLISGSQRLGIAIPLIALFVLGMVFLKWVKPMGERS